MGWEDLERDPVTKRWRRRPAAAPASAPAGPESAPAGLEPAPPATAPAEGRPRATVGRIDYGPEPAKPKKAVQKPRKTVAFAPAPPAVEPTPPEPAAADVKPSLPGFVDGFLSGLGIRRG